jgi:hypothetical protein
MALPLHPSCVLARRRRRLAVSGATSREEPQEAATVSGDYTRVRFDPSNDFSGVLLQQGRVTLDADVNEQVDLLDRRLRAEVVDTLARGAVSRETPNAFLLAFAGGDLTIARDRAISAALHLMSEFTPNLLPAGDRATFLALLLDQSFQTLEAAWRSQARRAREAQAGATSAQLAAWHAANPNGFPLDPVWTQFERTLARLARLTADARKARK